MSAERWRSVIGFEGKYEVSDRGRVRSVDRIVTTRQRKRDGSVVVHHRQGMILTPALRRGYPFVGLSALASDGFHRSKMFSVHVLVLKAFVGPRPDGHVGCHFDDNPLDNRLEKLRWGTHSDNHYDSVRNGTKPMGEAHNGSKLTKHTVLRISLYVEGKIGKGPYSTREIARWFSVCPATVTRIRDRTTWRHMIATATHDEWEQAKHPDIDWMLARWDAAVEMRKNKLARAAEIAKAH